MAKMELGGLMYIEYRPQWRGNRQLPDEDQQSLDLYRLTAGHLLSGQLVSEEVVEEWKKTPEVQKWIEHKEYGKVVAAWSDEVWHMVKTLVDYTRDWRNFIFDGSQVTDPLEIFVRMPMKPLPRLSADMSDEEVKEKFTEQRKSNLLIEINQALSGMAGLTEEEAKNFVSQFDGLDMSLIANATPAGTDTSPNSASIPPAKTDDSLISAEA